MYKNIKHLLVTLQIKAIKGKVLLIGAGRYHTAMCTSSELYTVGKNLGQLGYEKTCDTQILPRTVWCRLIVTSQNCDVYLDDYGISHF